MALLLLRLLLLMLLLLLHPASDELAGEATAEHGPLALGLRTHTHFTQIIRWRKVLLFSPGAWAAGAPASR